MEAPKKIYFNPLLTEDGDSIVRECTFERHSGIQIEYTNIDAFIEKACEWLINNTDITHTGIKNFRKAMKRE